MENSRIKLVLGTVILVALVSFSFTANQNKGNNILTVSVTEAPLGGVGWNNFIIIVDEESKAETVQLEKPNLKEPAKNLITINRKLNDIVNKGYKLLSTAEAGGDNVNIVTYTFIRE